MTPRARALAFALLALLAVLAVLATYALACPLESPVNEKEKITCNFAANLYFEPCFNGEPVNSMTGNLSEEQTDLSLNGRGPALAITRSYNSKEASEAKEAGPWGYGWSGPYGSHLEINKESGAIIEPGRV
jgi:hypothetical protein